MTTSQCTPSFVHLDHEDLDGLIDIAKYGLTPLKDNPATINLVERLANTIARHATGQAIQWQDHNTINLDAEDTQDNLLGGMALMQIWPVDGMYSNQEN